VGSAAFAARLPADWGEPLLDAAALLGELPRDLLTQPLGLSHHLFQALEELSQLFGGKAVRIGHRSSATFPARSREIESYAVNAARQGACNPQTHLSTF